MIPIRITKVVKQSEYSDYIDFDDVLNFDECWELLKEYVKGNNIRISGIEHQENYLPVIDDEYVVLLTIRAWGLLMSEGLSLVDCVEYNYAQWGWWTPIT